MARGSILLLEKNPKIMRTVELAAKRAGYRIDGIPWGSEGVPYLGSHRVDGILMNIRQPDMATRDICQKIRELPQYSRFPLIVMYGKQTKEDRSEFLKAGADDFVNMPFSPIDLMMLIETRLRPFRDAKTGALALSTLDGQSKQEIDILPVTPLNDRGDFEKTSWITLYSRIFFNKQSGLLNLVIKKEAKTMYFENGELLFIESMSRKDDLGEFMARNGAGTGTGKDIIAGRTQAGGPGCDPREFRMILDEVGILDVNSFNWWASLYTFEYATELFAKTMGTYHWQSLPIPEYARDPDFESISLPNLIFEGIRRHVKWWIHRDKLPPDKIIPTLTSRFHEMAIPYGLTLQEITMLKVINGVRDLKKIRVLCHRIAKNIDNYLFACHELQLISMEETSPDKSLSQIDSEIDEDDPESTLISSVQPDRQEPDAIDDESITEVETRALPEIKPPVRREPPPREPVERESPPERIREEIREIRPKKPQIEVPDFKEDVPIPRTDRKTLETIEGVIKDLPVLELFRLCIDRNFNGCTDFQNIGITKQVFWKRGKIVSAISGDIDERLDNYIFRKHLITSEQRDILRTSSQDAPVSPNDILKFRFLSIEQVFKVVKELIESIVRELFSWTSGSYKLIPDVPPPKDVVPMDLSPEVIIMNGLRELKSWDHLKSRLPHPDDRIAKNKTTRINEAGLKLTPLELRILNILAEPLPVQEILRRIGTEDEKVLNSLYSMEITGLVTRSGRQI
jgi:CheY-like chemotaxis protein